MLPKEKDSANSSNKKSQINNNNEKYISSRVEVQKDLALLFLLACQDRFYHFYI